MKSGSNAAKVIFVSPGSCTSRTDISQRSTMRFANLRSAIAAKNAVSSAALLTETASSVESDINDFGRKARRKAVHAGRPPSEAGTEPCGAQNARLRKLGK